MRTKLVPQLAMLLIGVAYLFISVAAATPPLQHPCHPGSPGGPGGPGFGPPCPPTPAPPAPGDGVTSPGSQQTGSLSQQVAFRVVNRTSENITLWLDYPAKYVLNVPAESEQMFTVDRNVYGYDLVACGEFSAGYMDLTTKSFFVVEPCPTATLVRVSLENQTGQHLALFFSGEGAYVIPLAPYQTRDVTIARGAYQVAVQGCAAQAVLDFQAHAGRTLQISCP